MCEKGLSFFAETFARLKIVLFTNKEENMCTEEENKIFYFCIFSEYGFGLLYLSEVVKYSWQADFEGF